MHALEEASNACCAHVHEHVGLANIGVCHIHERIGVQSVRLEPMRASLVSVKVMRLESPLLCNRIVNVDVIIVSF